MGNWHEDPVADYNLKVLAGFGAFVLLLIILAVTAAIIA